MASRKENVALLSQRLLVCGNVHIGYVNDCALRRPRSRQKDEGRRLFYQAHAARSKNWNGGSQAPAHRFDSLIRMGISNSVVHDNPVDEAQT